MVFRLATVFRGVTLCFLICCCVSETLRFLKCCVLFVFVPVFFWSAAFFVGAVTNWSRSVEDKPAGDYRVRAWSDRCFEEKEVWMLNAWLVRAFISPSVWRNTRKGIMLYYVILEALVCCFWWSWIHYNEIYVSIFHVGEVSRHDFGLIWYMSYSEVAVKPWKDEFLRAVVIYSQRDTPYIR